MPAKLITELSTDSLLHVFIFCDITDLCRLKRTCSRFNKIIERYLNQILTTPALVTNQRHLSIQERLSDSLCGADIWKVSHNWQIGRYKEKAFLYERKNFIPWLHLTSNRVWISRGPFIKAYERHNGKIDVRHPLYVLSTDNLCDVSRFVKYGDCLVSGQCDGGLFVWSKNQKTTSIERHEKEINAVDIHSKLIVSGSKDCSFNLWSCDDNFTKITLRNKYTTADRILSTSFNENGSSLGIGTSGCNDRAALKIYDVSSVRQIFSLGEEFQKGAGVLDMKWENDKILLACGYDSCVRKWDLRTGTCVQIWDDPFEGTVYCLDTDRCCTIMTGTQSYGRVVLFDTRKTKYVQMYFMETCKIHGRSSPVYSLAFDAGNLFVATDQHLNVLDFRRGKGKIRNYSELYRREIKIRL